MKEIRHSSMTHSNPVQSLLLVQFGTEWGIMTLEDILNMCVVSRQSSHAPVTTCNLLATGSNQTKPPV